MKTTEIIALSRVRVRRRCPSCGRASLRRSAEPQKETISANGEALWTMTEACMMCEWKRTYADVKIGL